MVKMRSSFFVQSPVGNSGFLPHFPLQLEKKCAERSITIELPLPS